MKSILQALFGKLLNFFKGEEMQTSKNILSSGSTLFEKSGKNSFFTVYISTLMYSIFGFIQKTCDSIFGQTKLSQNHRFKVNVLGVFTLVLFFLPKLGFSQTTLTAGDIAIIQYDADNPDKFTFVPLVDLQSGTVINFTDNSFASATTGLATEGFLTYTAPAAVSKGTPVTWTNGMTITGTGWSSAAPTNFAFNSAGDQLWVFQGNTANWATQTGISLISGLSQTTAFLTTGTASAGSSYKPSALSASFITTLTLENGYFANGTSAQTSVTVSATKSALQALFFDNTKWFTNGTGPLTAPTYSITVSAGTPTITGAATATAFTTTYGTASASQSFSIGGTGLTASITATAPTGFEVSSDGTTYGATATFTQSGGTASGTLRIRLAASAIVGGTYNSQTISLASSGATTINIATASSGNAVTAKGLTINGISASSKIYDGNTTASLSGTPAYVGLANGESFSVAGTAVATFTNKTVANGKAVTVTGYTAPSGNYTVAQPTGLTADITVKTLTIPDAAVVTKTFDGTTAATITGTLTGIVSGDSVTFASGTSAFANNGPGTGIAVNAGCTISGADAANYTLTQPTGLTGTINAIVSPTISVNPTSTAAFTTTYGTASSSKSFTVTGSALTNDITVAAGSGFEVSSDNTTFGATATFFQTSGSVTGTLSIRLAATAAVTGSYNSATAATLSSIGASTVTLATPSSGNNVTAKSLTITGVSAAAKVYDGTTAATVTGTPAYVGLENGESFSVTGTATASFATKTVGTSKTVTVTGYTAPSTNYTVTQPSLTADITVAPLTIAGAAVTTKAYDGTTAATITGTLATVFGTDVVSFASGSSAFASANAGSGIAVTAACTISGADSGNYSLTQPSGLTGTITQASQTITGLAATASKLTTDAPYALTAVASSGLAVSYSSSNTAVATISGATVTIVGAGTTTITASQAGNSNYSAATPVTQTLTVSAGPSTLVAGDVAIVSMNSANPDSFSIVLLKDINANTVINFTDNGFTGTDTTGRTGEGFLTFTAPTALPFGTVLTWTNGVTSTSGTGWSSNNPTNFAFNGSGDQLFIFQGSTSNWASQSGITLLFGMNYGIALSATSGAGNTLQPNSSILPATAFLNLPTATNANGYFSNTGSSATTVSLCGTSASILANIVTAAKWFGTTATAATFPTYTFTTPCTNPVITGTATASAFTTTYGTPSAAQTFAVSGTNLTANITATGPAGFEFSTNGTTWGTSATFAQTSGTVSGTLSIRLAATASVASNFNAQNIVLASTGATSVNITTSSTGNVVNAKNLTISGISGVNKIYDGNNTASLTGTPAYVGLVNGESFTVTGTPTATFASVNVATAIGISITGYTAPSSNYTITQPSTSADITAKALTITGLTVVNKPYDTTTTATLSGTPSLLGVVSGDTVTLGGTYTADFASSAVGTGIAVTVTGYTISGASVGNYTLTQPQGLIGDITAVNVPSITSSLTASGTYGVAVSGYTITATNSPDTYNATGLPAGLSITNGVISGTPTVTGTFNVTISATNVGGTGSATLVYTISPKELTVTGASVSSKTYDGTTAATILGASLNGIVFSDTVTVSGNGTFASANVGTGISVTPALTLSGTNATNYTLTQPTLSGDITAKSLTVTANNVTKTPAQVLTGGAGSLAFSTNGLVGSETVGSVTITYGASGGATGSGNTVGIYPNEVTPSLATGGTFLASNYTITYVSGSVTVAGFSTGNLVVNRLGDGTTSIGSIAAPISLLEVTTTGTLVNTLSTAFTGTNLLTDTGSGTSNGNLNTNGTYLAVPGSNSAVGTSGVASLNTKATNIFGLGYTVANRVTFPTGGPSATPPSPFSGNNFRSVIATSTNTFYASGTSTGSPTTGGIWYYNGSSFSNIYNTINNTRNVEIFNGNLYFSTGSGTAGIYQVGTGLPTTTGQTATLLFATVTTSPYGFAISPDGNTAFVADDSAVNGNTGGGIQKWSKASGSWVRQYTLGTIARGLTVDFSSTSPIIYATTGEATNNKIIRVTDTGSALTATDVISAGANYVFRGIDFAPSAPSPKITASGTVAACSTVYGTSSSVTSFTAAGTNMLGAITVTPPAGFEVSTTSDFSANVGTSSSPITIGAAGTIASTTIYVRIPATTGAGTYSGNIVLTSSFSNTLNVATASSVVSAKALTITGLTAVTKVYDGTTAATLSGTPEYAGLVNGQTFSVTGTPIATFGDKNVGTAKAVTVIGYTAPSANYTVTQPTGLTADITAKDLTVTNITANNKVYDGTVNATLSATLEGVIAPDNVTLLATGEFESTFQTIFFGIPGNIVNLSFTLNGSAGDVANYNLVQPNTSGLSADIYPKALTISNPTAFDKVYDGTTDAVVTGTLVGVVSGDSVTLISSGTFASAEIGTNIAVTPSWVIDGDTFNYTLTEPTVSLTANITSPSAPSITSATTASATYGDLTTSYFITATGGATSYNATGLPSGLTVNTETGEITGSPSAAGVYTVTLSATNSGGTGFATLTYTINTINLTLTGASANDKAYDGTTTATISGTLTGYISGDDISFNGSGTFDSAAVGSNIFVTPSITLTGTKAPNYTFTQPSGLTANITAKVLTVSASVNDKVYDRTTSATVTVSTVNGVVGSEVVNVTATGTFDTANAGTGKNVTVSYSLNGLNAANYSIVSPVTLTGNITPKPLTYTATADNKVFDGNTNATITVTAITGIIAPDAVTITGTGTFASSAIANGIVVSNINLTLGGAQASNYSIVQPTGTLTANITVAPTVLSAGDIAVIGYNTSGTPDNFAILVLKDLTSGTQFFVNDNELATTTSTSFTDLAEMEASFTVKSGQTIPAGTVIVLPWGAAAVSTTTYDWSSTSGAGFGASNDEIYIYTAPSITATTPTAFIYFAKLGTSPSAIPTSLETSTTGTGTTAISPTAAALRYNTTTNIYNSCKQILLNEIGKTATANWTTTGSAALAANDWTFTVLATCPTPTITTNISTLAALTTVYGLASTTTTFTVTGTYLTDNVIVNAPSGFEISTNGTTGFGSTLTLTQISGGVSATIYVRLNASTTVLLSPYTGNITLSSTGASNVNVATAPSTVTPKELTITGILVNNKVQNIGDFSATLSGTPVLNGVLSIDTANVTLDSSAVTAVFAQDTAGINIPVTVSGYSLTGTAAGNYLLIQPSLTGTITSVASPVITSALTFSAIYGTPATDYTITATSDVSYPVTGYNATGLPSGLSINTTTGVISGTPTAAPGTYSVTISASNVGGTTNAFLAYTIAKKEITVTATASNKVYNANTTATINVNTISGVVGSDVVTVTGGGNFDTKNVGTAKPVTASLVLGGSQAGNYSLTQPSGLTADISAFPLTLTGAAAQNKVFDGNNSAIITATLVGIIGTDVVTFNGTGTFATSTIGQGIAVTSTATLAGADAGNYSFVQPTGLTANITDTIIYLNTFTGASACPTNGNVPTMVTNSTGTALTRNTITCNATGNVFNSTTLNNTASINNNSYIEFSASATAGNKLSITSLSFFRQASASAPNKLEVRYSTDGFATSTTWGAAPNSPTTGTVITWDFSDFTTPTGGTVTFRLYPYGATRADNTGASSVTGTFRVDDVTIYGKVLTGPTAAALSLTGNSSFCSGTSSTIKVDITGGTAPYTVVYSNGSNTTLSSYVSGSDITVTPTTTSTYSLVSVTDANGIALNSNLTGSATFTVSPTTSHTTTASACDSYTWAAPLGNGTTYTTSGTYTNVSTNEYGCNHTETLVLTINNSTSSSESVTACDTYTWSVNGATYTTSGTYTYTSTNATGCTDTKTLVLTINNSTTSTETVTSPTCGTYTWAVNGQTYTSSGTYTYTGTNASGCTDTRTLVLTITPCESVLNVKMNIEGYYDTTTHAMRPVLANQGVGSSSTDVDTVTIELHDATTFALVATADAMLQTDGNAVATFSSAPVGSFYIAVKHRNVLETWSAEPQTIGASSSYDFTNAANKAMGDNMQLLESGVYGMYSGDLDQDGNIGLSDYSVWEESYNNFDAGYFPSDIDGNGNVDLGDYSIWEANYNNFISAIHP